MQLFLDYIFYLLMHGVMVFKCAIKWFLLILIIFNDNNNNDDVNDEVVSDL